VDSSVWIGHFRNSVSERVRLLRSLCGQEELQIGDIVLMEMLRGARDEPHAARLGRELHDFEVVPMLGEALAVRVVRNYRALRAVGLTVRNTPDLIIATTASRTATPCCTTIAISNRCASTWGCRCCDPPSPPPRHYRKGEI
jgi:predicted nucleic acid-binding protein